MRYPKSRHSSSTQLFTQNEINRRISKEMAINNARCAYNKRCFPQFDEEKNESLKPEFANNISTFLSVAPTNTEAVQNVNVLEKIRVSQENYDQECGDLDELNQNLIKMMEQLAFLTKNKNIALKIVSELQVSYMNLLKKCDEQENELKTLREENCKLLNQIKNQTLIEDPELSVVKKNLEQCESKLENLERSTERIIKNYQNCQEAEARYTKENECLLEMNNRLRTRLRQAMLDLERYRNNDHLSCIDPQMGISEEAKQKYQEVLLQQKSFESRMKIFEENDVKRLQEIISTNEMKLEGEMIKITNYIDQKSINKITSSEEIIHRKPKPHRKHKKRVPQLQTVLSKEEMVSYQDQPMNPIISAPSMPSPSRSSRSMLLEESRCSINITETLSDLIQVIHEEIDQTLIRDQQIQQQCKKLCCLDSVLFPKIENDSGFSQDEATLIEDEFLDEELQLLETKYCTTIDEDYELECVCEPCDET